MTQYREIIKNSIKKLIDLGNLSEAGELVQQCQKIVKNDIELYSMQAVIAMLENRFADAEAILEQGLLIDKNNFDLLYNLAYVYEGQNNNQEAYALYLKLSKDVNIGEYHDLVLEAIQRLQSFAIDAYEEVDSKKIVFFVKQGLDSFLDDIVNSLSETYETKKMIITHTSQIDEGMQWADICWFEWCDELVDYGSKLEVAKHKKIICRLHSYEAFTEYPLNVKWENVDKLIFVAEHIRDFLLGKVNSLKKENTIVIPNGIELGKYRFKTRKSGFNIAYVGYVNYKKGPMLLLHAFKAIYDKDHRYKLYIAGNFQDDRDVLYYRQMIKEMGLSNNVVYEGWQDNLDQWLDDKNYILCTSLLESQNMSVMQAMSKGIKPLIHNFVGAKGIYPKNYIWNTINDCVKLTFQKDYDSKAYHDYITNNFSLKLELERIDHVLDHDLQKQHSIKKNPLVTVGIPNFNYARYLDDCIQSILEQSYQPIEILVIDDCSTDNSVEKLKEYEKKYENIRIIYHEKNSGSCGLALQEIIKEAKGEYLTILSADDFWSNKDSIKDLVQSISADQDLDYVFCNMNIVDKDKNDKDVWRYKEYSVNEIVLETFNRGGSGVIPLTVGITKVDYFRRNNLTFYDDKDNRVAGDTLNILINSKMGWKIKHLDKALMSYRHHSNNITYDLGSRITSIISVIEYLVKNFDERIFLPQVKWNTYSENNKMALRMFLIGKHYYTILRFYYEGNWTPWVQTDQKKQFEKEELQKFVQPLLKKIVYYFNESITINSKHSKEINKIKKEIMLLGVSTTGSQTTVPVIAIKSLEKDLVFEGQKLRDGLLNDYKDMYTKKSFKTLILSPDNGAWKYSFQSWKNILEHMGVSVDIIYEIDPKVDYQSYNIFIGIANKYFINKMQSNQTIINIVNKIGIGAKDSFNGNLTQDDTDVLKTLYKDHIFSFLVSSGNDVTIKNIFSEWIRHGINIYSIPFGFNPLIHFPESAEVEYDYFFVGHNSYLKAEETKKYLIPIVNKYQGLLRGTGWGESFTEISPNDVRYYYNRAKINLNYHLQIQKRYKCEVNERTYIIGACGGFQLVDNPMLIKELYSEKEIAIAKDHKQYLEMFAHYLNKPDERINMAYKAMVKTYKNNSSLFHRMESMINTMLKK